jgi:hypothetical protein
MRNLLVTTWSSSRDSSFLRSQISWSSLAIFLAVCLVGQAIPGCDGRSGAQSAVARMEKSMSSPVESRFPVKPGIDKILPVRGKNILLTNSLDNALTRLELSGSDVEYATLSADYLRDVAEGEFVFVQPTSDTLVFYAQNRAVIVFDLEQKKHAMHLLCTSFEESIVGLEPLRDGSFLVTVEKFIDDVGNADIWLRRYRLTFNGAEQLGELKLGTGEETHVSDTSIFVYGRNEVRAYDSNFAALEHPVTAFREVLRDREGGPSEKAKIYDLFVHPTQPFAILDLDYSKYVLQWKDPNAPVLFGSVLDDASFFDLSPDGKWIKYWDSGTVTRLMAVPVDPESIHFLGVPVQLGRFDAVPYAVAGTWTPNPIAYVLADVPSKTLIQWSFSDE